MFPKYPEAEKRRKMTLGHRECAGPGGGGGGEPESLTYTTKEASNLLRAEISEDTISC